MTYFLATQPVPSAVRPIPDGADVLNQSDLRATSRICPGGVAYAMDHRSSAQLVVNPIEESITSKIAPSDEGVADERVAAQVPGCRWLASMHRSFPGYLLFVLLMAPIACSERAEPPSMNDVRSEAEPTQESWNIHLIISEAGSQTNESRTRFEIRADYMATFETSDSTYTVMQSDTSGRRVLAHFYDEAGDTSATLHADRLILHDEDRRFEAMDNVIVVTPDGKTLESEHLVWLENDRKLRTPGFVRITTPSERVQGYNLLADEDLTTYTLARVTGQVTVEDDAEEYESEDTSSLAPAGEVILGQEADSGDQE